ncbi:hypothetical protein K466DRAFT_597278 [Polyporus arcularius HHB13444]|uniref:Uncharacterized protein n=1 Tax=Polyporus arcularius HHB13444 TaxID=1314778 RepID=A0A5C3PJU9_9APHY|nr:hypothetical protein K466DRAFT_597278 [Polyporus arcularius HHB13444]
MPATRASNASRHARTSSRQPRSQPQRNHNYQDSARAIREWQQRLPQFLAQANNHKVITAIMYPIASTRPRAIRVPVFVDPDEDPHASGWVSDVHSEPWFPNGTTYTRIHTVPGSNMLLGNDYTIITSRHPRREPTNQAARRQLGMHVKGNILVVRHARGYSMTATNVHSAEHTLIDHVVQQTLQRGLGKARRPLTRGA